MMDNKNNKHSPAFDLEALTKAYERSLNDVTLGGKDIPTPDNVRAHRNTQPVGELKSFVPDEGVSEHDKIVDKIRADRRKRSHSVWTDNPLLKPKKSVWIDDEAEERPAEPVKYRQPERQQPVQKQLPPDFIAPLPVMTKPSEPKPIPDFDEVVDAAMDRPVSKSVVPLLNERPRKQELQMKLGSQGDARVREVPRRVNKQKVTVDMSGYPTEDESPNKRTVSLKMPLSKMNLDDLREPLHDKKAEKTETAKAQAVSEPADKADEHEKTAEFSPVRETAEMHDAVKAVEDKPSADVSAVVNQVSTEANAASEEAAAVKAEEVKTPEMKHSVDDAYDFADMIKKIRTEKKGKVDEEYSRGGVSEHTQITDKAQRHGVDPKYIMPKKNLSKRKKSKTHELEFHFINCIMCICIIFVIFFSLLFMERESGFINSENRNLAEFPSFSIKDYFSGKYTKAIDDYFTDTIPGREELKKFGAAYERLKGIDLGGAKVSGTHKTAEKETLDEKKRAAVTTVTANTDPKAVTTTKAKGKDGKKTTTSKKEKVVKLPEILDDGVLEGDVIVFGKGKDVRAVAGYYGMFETGALYAKTINKYKEAMPEVNVYNMTIPTSAAYYMPKNFKDIVADQKDNIDNIASELSGIINVDVFDAIGAHANEYIYSRTDHHWQPLGAYYAGRVFAEKAGVKYADIKTYEKFKIDGFLGTMYAYSNYDSKLEANPDTFIYYKPDNNYTTKYYNTDFTNGEEGSLFFDFAEGVNCYSAILGKDEEITEITTDADNGRTLVIFKDSFGNALVPFLTHSFEKIYVCDFRYFDENAIEFCRAVGCTDLLFSISITSCSTETHITAINNNRVQDSAVPLEIQSDEPEESQPEEKPDENESKPEDGNADSAAENNENTDNADDGYED
ncbi:DHHW family protein [Ruminococcus albus]|uniref:DHHW protein n=1 Tax=Ruminococcus albus (strain ATCC 27210 / DSM 20455 / JCM 14654 / NCDO 2250 / 7) TaxID=697329 RepID=E6UCG6_RUMA7|nr:DHHW family protein [Ruminococcus albus]ADU20758.1 hypothetical protein Rumal_0201 [Ruminococcus albus 7 = DSM 20455]